MSKCFPHPNQFMLALLSFKYVNAITLHPIPYFQAILKFTLMNFEDFYRGRGTMMSCISFPVKSGESPKCSRPGKIQPQNQAKDEKIWQYGLSPTWPEKFSEIPPKIETHFRIESYYTFSTSDFANFTVKYFSTYELRVCDTIN